MTAAISYWQTPKPTDQLMQLCLNKIVNPPFNKPTNFQIKCWFWFRIDTYHFVGERSQLRTSIIVISYLLTVSTVIRGQEWNQWKMTLLHTFMHQAHPTTGPVGCLASVRYPARKAKWSAFRNFTPVLFSWSHQAMCPLTASHGCTIMYCQNTHNYKEPRAAPARASYGAQNGLFGVFHTTRAKNGFRAGPMRDNQNFWCKDWLKLV